MNPASDDESRALRRRSRLASIVEEALHISESYRPEPVLATTGKGALKSKGVAGLAEDAAFLRERKARLKSNGHPS